MSDWPSEAPAGSAEWRDAHARARAHAGRHAREDEREFAPALRAMARAKKLAPQLHLLGRIHMLLGVAALSFALTASLLLSGALLLARERPGWAFAAGGVLVAGLAAMGAPWLALGFGLRRRRAWARTLGIACAVVLLPFPPIGTALGAWTLAVLLAWNPRLAQAVEAE